jgi:hypothetical protein
LKRDWHGKIRRKKRCARDGPIFKPATACTPQKSPGSGSSQPRAKGNSAFP